MEDYLSLHSLYFFFNILSTFSFMLFKKHFQNCPGYYRSNLLKVLVTYTIRHTQFLLDVIIYHHVLSHFRFKWNSSYTEEVRKGMKRYLSYKISLGRHIILHHIVFVTGKNVRSVLLKISKMFYITVKLSFKITTEESMKVQVY